MDGFINLLKPPGMTSNNAVYDVRRIFSEKKVGHLGTLDPGASGVLPVCVGRATRLFDLLVEKEKTYIFEIAFGVATDTQDVFGRVTDRSDRVVPLPELEEALPFFRGDILQKASVYSALKVDGKKMCDLARAGKPVMPKTRAISVSHLAVLRQTGENRFLMEMRCSRGTYVRSLCAEIGERLGTPAHMAFLLRTASGPFRLEQTWTVEELEREKEAGRLMKTLLPCEEALAFLPEMRLPSNRLVPTKNGLETSIKGAADGMYRVSCGGFLGVGTVKNESLKLTVHLYD